jgi:preprotein translocase subunit YajC
MLSTLFLSSVAYAQDAAPAAGAAGLTSFLPFVAIIAVFYFLLIRPQQKKQKELNESINSLKSGDQIITTSGFFATVDSVIDPNTFMINLGGGVKVKIVRSGIAGKVNPDAGVKNPAMEQK